MIRRPGIVSRFRVVGNRAELNYRGTTSIEMLYPPMALVERRNLGDGVIAVLLETANGMRALLIGEETIAEVAALPTSSADPRAGSFQLDALVRDHFQGAEVASGASVPAPESAPATLTTDGTFVTLATAAERHHFMLSGTEVPTLIGSATIDEHGDMLLSLRLPNRTVVALRVAADGVVDAEKALVALQVASASRPAATQSTASWARQPPRPTMAPSEHPEADSVLVMGILSLVCCGFLGPFAWAKGNSVVAEMDRSSGVIWTNRGTATAGRICGIISSVMLGLGVLAFFLSVVAGGR